MSKKLISTSPLAIKRAGDQGEVRGYGAVFNNVDLMGDRILPGAFAESLAAHQGSRCRAAGGQMVEMVKDDHGLRVVGQLALASAAGREAVELVSAGASGGLSAALSCRPAAGPSIATEPPRSARSISGKSAW